MKKNFNVIGIGEILWDVLPDGKLLGGAPANFAYHLCQLDADGGIISAINEDKLGNEIREKVEKLGFQDYLSISEKPTGTVTVLLEDGIPSYTIHENVAWDNIDLTVGAKTALLNCDAICFGTLAQRSEHSRKNIWKALEMVPKNCLKIFDVNLRQDYYSKEIVEKSLHFANVCKLNDEELVVLTDMFGLNGSDEEKCRLLMDAFGLDVLALTMGTSGSILLSEEERSEQPTPLVEVADTIGAGDSFTATMAMGLLKGLPLKQIHSQAIQVSAYICTQKGATPVIPEDLKYKATNTEHHI